MVQVEGSAKGVVAPRPSRKPKEWPNAPARRVRAGGRPLCRPVGRTSGTTCTGLRADRPPSDKQNRFRTLKALAALQADQQDEAHTGVLDRRRLDHRVALAGDRGNRQHGRADRAWRSSRRAAGCAQRLCDGFGQAVPGHGLASIRRPFRQFADCSNRQAMPAFGCQLRSLRPCATMLAKNMLKSVQQADDGERRASIEVSSDGSHYRRTRLNSP